MSAVFADTWFFIAHLHRLDPEHAAALRLARLNFETQKDTPDLRMYAAAAIAAADASAMADIRAWMRETGFEDRVVAASPSEAA